MQQPVRVRVSPSAPPETPQQLITHIHGELRSETRAALVAALFLKQDSRPWDQLLPIIMAGLPALADALGPVEVPRLEAGLSRPRWTAAPGALPSWYDTLAALELAALLVPRHTMLALKHRREAGPGARVEWLEGDGHPGLAGLL